jgi:hypothetical protein
MMDGVRSAARLAGTGLALCGDSVAARVRGFPRSVGEVTPDWLSEALGERYPGTQVRGFELLDEHSGTTSRARIALDYAQAGASADDGQAPPPSIFLKLTPIGVAQRLFVTATGLGRNELGFYRDIRDGLPVRAPRVHGLRTLGGGRHFVMLLEDLVPRDVRLAVIGDRIDLAQARLIVLTLARLHAAYWESPRLVDELRWLPSYERRLRRDMPWERFVTGKMTDMALTQFRTEFSPGFVEIARLCADRRDHLEKLWSEGPRTLVHGDCHLGNLFFEHSRAGHTGEHDVVGLFDWQVCARAPGLRDVSYLLCNSFSSELRRAHERELIALYLSALEGHGVQAPSPEAAFRMHRLFALYTWIAAAFTAAAGSGLQSREIAVAGLRRATTAAEELESVACALG